jgi:hypoxanthine phosphoribosyltransferase
MDKTYITQEEFTSMTLDLSRRITATKRKFFNVYGIERGGVYVSEPVAKYMLTDHRTFKISFYSEKDSINPEPVYDFRRYDFDHIKKNSYVPFLLVDDLLDSATTLNWFIEKTGLVQGKHFYFACLYYNPNNKFGLKPNFYIREKKENEWIVFPHEARREAEAQQMAASV